MRSPRAPGRFVLAAIVPAVAGCELQEIVTAEPIDVVVAEVVLRAGETRQLALLHRTGRAGPPRAEIEVRASSGAVMRYSAAPLAECIEIPDDADFDAPTHASCWSADGDAVIAIEPGARYTLTIRLEDGGIMTGATTVPGDFTITAPPAPACTLPADTPLTLRWTRAADAWAYGAEAVFTGLRAALATERIDVPEEPLRLFGVAVASHDTAIAFPSGFGLFHRFDEEFAATLVRLQRGVPAAVSATVAIAAADRNYVNWARGGGFNPSGEVRVPSIRGAGTGAFGAIVPRTVRISTEEGVSLPGC
jgi:hypothetical protein